MTKNKCILTLLVIDLSLNKLIPELLNEMSTIRRDVMNDKRCSYTQTDAYFHLNINLASYLKERILTDSRIKDLSINLSLEVEKDEALLYYDPLQDKYWHDNNPLFTNSLNRLALLVCNDIEDDCKHHLLQGVKYLDTYGALREKQLKYFNSIKPFSGGLHKDTANYYFNIIKIIPCFFKTNTINYFYINDFTAGANGTCNNEIIAGLGFMQVISPSSLAYDYSLPEDLKDKGTLIDNPYFNVFIYLSPIKGNEDLTFDKVSLLFNNFGINTVYALSEPIRRDCQNDNVRELCKRAVFYQDRETVSRLNNPEEPKWFFSKDCRSYWKHLVVLDDCLCRLITTDSVNFDDYKKNLLHLFASNKDNNEFILDRLHKIIGGSLLYAQINKLIDNGCSKVADRIYF